MCIRRRDQGPAEEGKMSLFFILNILLLSFYDCFVFSKAKSQSKHEFLSGSVNV